MSGLALPSPLRRLAGPALTAAAAALVLLVAGQIVSPGFASPDQIVRQLTVASILGLVAAGQNLVVLGGREGIDLSVGGVMSLAALLAGNVMAGSDAMVLPALGAVIAVGLVVGLCNGFGITALRIPPLVMTLGTAGVIAGLLVVLTRGRTSGSAAPLLVSVVTQPLVFGLPGILLIWAGLGILLTALLARTRFGVNLAAVGTNDYAADLAGIPVRATRIVAYALSGALSGIAGLMLLGYTGTVFVGAGEQYVLPSVIAVVIGGTALSGGQGGYAGTAAGAVFLTLLTALLTTINVDPAMRQVIFGGVLILFMAAYGREAPARG